MERLKNGELFSAKYMSCQKGFKPPIVIVMSNFELNFKECTADRWLVNVFENNDSIQTYDIINQIEHERKIDDILLNDNNFYLGEYVNLNDIILK